jgi:hypothetical protein
MTETSTLNYTSLIENCSKNHRQSQQELYELVSPGMFALCIKYCKTRKEAEVVLEEGFIKLFKNIQTYPGNASFIDWCKLIFISTAFQHPVKIHPLSALAFSKSYYHRLQLKYKALCSLRCFGIIFPIIEYYCFSVSPLPTSAKRRFGTTNKKSPE